MDDGLNPYSPGAGRRPPELAGREPELRRFDAIIERIESGRTDRGLILSGLRGVGKTVLLNEFRRRAELRHWIVAKVEAGGDRPLGALAAQALAPALRAASRNTERRDRLSHALAVFKSFSLKLSPDGGLALGLDVEPARGHADTGELETDLTELATELARAAADQSVGVLLLIDEMQDLARAELAAISAACHETGQLDLPFLLVGAGLPNLPVALTEAKSYAERLFEYIPVGPLGPDAAADALTVPAHNNHVEWDSPALALITDVSAGYPYFLQVYGNMVWRYASHNPIVLADAEVGVLAARQELDSGFYGSRWERATPAQQAYLRAVAEGGDEPSSTTAVAQRLNRRPSELSVARSELIKKGLLYAAERGHIAFTVPGMADFVRRQTL